MIMTIKEFENKYWYMSELKALAKSLEIPFDSKIRKDQLEEMIIQFGDYLYGSIYSECFVFRQID